MPVNGLIFNTGLFLQAKIGPGTYTLAIPELHSRDLVNLLAYFIL